jgi:NAD(P)-dependent dehydrogenase (short-subunit alcohol dehydrogenase family)
VRWHVHRLALLAHHAVVLVTGPSQQGIGAETAYSRARAEPALLILAGRSKTKIQPVVDDIAHRSPGVKTTIVHLELDNQESVRQAVEDVKKLNVQIDGLINNAAIMACPYSKTVDGIEMQFGTNYIGHFLFTNLLLQAGVIPDGAHIVNVSSSASEATDTRPHFDDLTYQDGKLYDPWIVYSVSKIASVLYTRSLSAKLKARKIAVLTLNPGSIRSPLQRYLDQDLVQAVVKRRTEQDPSWKFLEQKSLQEGCSTTLRAALDPSLSGKYPAIKLRVQANSP